MVEKLTAPALARKTVETYLTEKIILDPSDYKVIGPEQEKAGVFVSIKYKSGELRGCIGTVLATQDSVEKEIVTNAISAATKDPRFEPIEAEEMGKLVFSVDVMSEPAPVDSASDLDPKVYGAIVRSRDGRQGLLLPNLEGVDTVEQQIAICKRKAGIPMQEKVYLFRFKADRYYE